MYEQFTDRARKVMKLAYDEARRFNHEYIGTEHILLGLVKEGSGVAANVLKQLEVDFRGIILEVEKLVQSGPEAVAKDKLPETPRAKKAIECALLEARNLNHNYVGTEHVLLGLMRVEEGVAAQVLVNLGLDLENVRKEVLLLRGREIGGALPSAQAKDPRSLLGPDAVDQQIKQAISMCWMMLPDEKKSVAAVESEIRRIVDRALANLREDSRSFGIPDNE